MHPKIAKLLEIPQPPQRSDEWYKARYTRLTASDLATALGINPYESSDSLVLKKCGLGERFTGNAATEHGARWEDFVRDKFCEETGLECFEAGLLPHPTIDFLGGSPDGLLSNKEGTYAALLEIKCPLRRRITGTVPAYYMPQLQLLMDICDLDEAYFVEFVPADTFTPEEYSVVKVPRDRQWFAESLSLMRLFWEKVEYMRANPDEALRMMEDMEAKKLAKKKRGKSGSTGPTGPRKRKAIINLDSKCLINIDDA